MSTVMLILMLQWCIATLTGLILVVIVSLYIRGAFRKTVQYQVQHGVKVADASFPRILASLSNSFLTAGDITHFWSIPDEIYAARLKVIQHAQRTIHFETFHMTPGRRAHDFAEAIIDRALAGVEVLLIADTYGTHTLPQRYWQRLRNAGVQVVFFNPFDWRAPANFAGRTHRKLLLIDGQIGLVGGTGISDDWDGEPHTPPWLDIEMQLEGEVVAYLEGQFMQHWTYSGGNANLRACHAPTQWFQASAQILVTAGNNPTYRFSPIRALKENIISAAQKRLWLASPYLLPDVRSRTLMIQAKQRGVDVRLLTASADTIDKRYVYNAAFELYGSLLAAGVEIYEYQPSMIHAKMLLVDDQWANTGSANFDSRSFFHNDELDLSSDNPRLIANLEQIFDAAFQDSCQVSLSDWENRSWWEHRILGQLVRFIQWQL